ncbi:XapX domain-containing protein [Alkalihalophilus pseudofirmus]|uniref:XapX domain-containing protein n=1 Tax=Alkalihalophilus pseudofirmus TaxID=79885 RepID=A0AAJ2U1I3_ALKPS|nr:XapX domain-containing protein [Alkalihalophilus pseudofirmus]MDV2886514.1 XapX domain-containing protein [Alkalihalophilus pseudofirmus]OLS38779.1 XapX domain-containing protein [Alkalihalophilus pseudofirmus]
MQEILLAILAGLIVGFVFALVKLPIPAPPALPGIMGIVGIYLGYKLYEAVWPLIMK